MWIAQVAGLEEERLVKRSHPLKGEKPERRETTTEMGRRCDKRVDGIEGAGT